MTPIVHVVDDEEVIRESLAWLLQSAGLTCRTWDSGEAFLAALVAEGPACAILDVRMDGLNGPAVFQQMLDAGHDLPVIFLTGHAEVSLAVEALKAGAFDFVEKPFTDNRLVEIVKAALDHHVRLRAIATDRTAIADRLSRLTTRERQVLDLMLRGQMNKQIAAALDLSMRTVEVHRASILDKFAVRSAVQLAGLLARGSE